jgi:prepilin peptidase CpaA
MPPLTEPFGALLLTVALAAYAAAAASDLAYRRIPDAASIAVVAAGVTASATASGPLGALAGLAWGAGLFMVLAWLCLRGLLGGGDAKLVSATAVLVGGQDMLGFLLATGIAGGVLALTYLTLGAALRRLGPGRLRPGRTIWKRFLAVEARRIRRGGGLPYGIAVSAGAVLALFGAA